MFPTQDLPPTVALRRMATAYWVSQALHAAASLGIADRLASGPKNAKQLARETESEPASLYRLLRALASVGVFEEGVDGQFSLTALGERLRSDVSESMLPWVLLLNGPLFQRAWENLVHSVRTGKPGFDEVYGQPAWDYYEAHPEAGELFNRAMTSTATIKRNAVVAGYDFDGIRKRIRKCVVSYLTCRESSPAPASTSSPPAWRIAGSTLVAASSNLSRQAETPICWRP
jgi:hypothetical protein